MAQPYPSRDTPYLHLRELRQVVPLDIIPHSDWQYLGDLGDRGSPSELAKELWKPEGSLCVFVHGLSSTMPEMAKETS